MVMGFRGFEASGQRGFGASGCLAFPHSRDLVVSVFNVELILLIYLIKTNSNSQCFNQYFSMKSVTNRKIFP